MALRAASNAVAAARAWAAAPSASTADVPSHPRYGAAALAITSDAGPDHGPAANDVTTESNDDTDARKSAANPSQAAAAVNNGPDPAPAKINAELISGGNHAKSIIFSSTGHDGRPGSETA
ncbi:hypothetical protein MSHI_00080 [Mycobacterium shinjukuense]|uniref:Uncharacterized protein n=1 Tax=Mycobacterium shinjukuense TaxID=398694 RepID=A0A7I7MJS4_9MYCO|nr:hypothetical protein MSHI_00080 [Mycobacterium shinjukuense]